VPRHPGGALSAWGAPIPVDALTPFADPKLCLPPPGTDRTAVISAARAVATVVVFVWQAVAVAISFLEAPRNSGPAWAATIPAAQRAAAGIYVVADLTALPAAALGGAVLGEAALCAGSAAGAGATAWSRGPTQ